MPSGERRRGGRGAAPKNLPATPDGWPRSSRAAWPNAARRSGAAICCAGDCALLPAHFVAPPSAMHDWLAEELGPLHRRRGSKLNVVGPRGGAKSTLGTLAYVLRAACEAWEPYIWIVSDTLLQAQMHLDNVKTELTSNASLAAVYPRACGQGPRWRAAAIELRSGIAIEAIGTGQRIRGRRRNAFRPTLVVCDDLQNDGHMSSAALRQASYAWFHGTLLKAGTPTTNIVNLATALHRDAIAMQLRTTPGWRSRLFRAIEQWPTRDDLWQEWERLYTRTSDDAIDVARAFYEHHRHEMDQGASVLWPEVEDLYTLMSMRVESGRTAFEREKQGAPIDPDGCEWPEEYFGEHLWFDQWPADIKLRTVALDPSKGSDAKRGDYSAFAMLAIAGDGTLYVEADLARRPTPQMVTDGVAICAVPTDCIWRRGEPVAGAVGRRVHRRVPPPGPLRHPASDHHQYREQTSPHPPLGPVPQPPTTAIQTPLALHTNVSRPATRLPRRRHDDGPDALEMALRLAEDVWHGD